MHDRTVEVLRAVDGTLIPSGTKVTLQPGTFVMITQALGDSYTVYVNGNLVRVAGGDGDALGLVILQAEDVNAMEGSVEEKVWIQLRTCYDPEIPVNIADLGLIYQCEVLPLGSEQYQIIVTMTLTAPGCGMGPVLLSEVESKIKQINGVQDVKMTLTFDPPWDRSKMTDEAKLQLGLL